MIEYIGSELELFKNAINWKNYYGSIIKKYIKGDVLEVGAGIGETTKTLHNKEVKSWVCLEPDFELADEIIKKKENGYLPQSIEIVKNTIDCLDSYKKFDTIVYIDVIEHIEKDKEELDKVFNFLNVNGHLIILVPAHNFLFSNFDKSIGHYRRYNKKMLKKITPNGLKNIELKYLDSLGLFMSLANKWFLKQEYPKKKQILFWDNCIIPISKFIDFLTFFSIGKSVIGIWQKK